MPITKLGISRCERILGSISHDMTLKFYDISELDEYKDKPVLVYCASGGRSPRAVDTLEDNEFGDIYHMYRGISSWRYEVTK